MARRGLTEQVTGEEVGPTFGESVANSALIAMIASLLVISVRRRSPGLRAPGADDPERDQQRHEPGRLAAEGVRIDERSADLHGEGEYRRGEREPASQQQRQRPQRRGQADGERRAGQVGDAAAGRPSN
jgi:hypothetical protein